MAFVGRRGQLRRHGVTGIGILQNTVDAGIRTLVTALYPGIFGDVDDFHVYKFQSDVIAVGLDIYCVLRPKAAQVYASGQGLIAGLDDDGLGIVVVVSTAMAGLTVRALHDKSLGQAGSGSVDNGVVMEVLLHCKRTEFVPCVRLVQMLFDVDHFLGVGTFDIEGGVVPAVFLTLEEEKHFSEEKMVEALYVAAGIGGVIANRAFLAGAAGGCQAEIGSASAMAAGGVAYLMGGDAEQISHAAALALKNLLGLACDPVAGLVEVPCVKRNVMGAVNAMTSSDMVMAGITSKIPPDEVIDAMRAIGRSMSEDIRETGKGGLAGTPTGVAIRERMAGTL